MTDLIDELVSLAQQYSSDLRRPPSGDSRERRLERIEAVLAKYYRVAGLKERSDGH